MKKSCELEINGHNYIINYISINSDKSLIHITSKYYWSYNSSFFIFQFIKEFKGDKERASINNISFYEYSNKMGVYSKRIQGQTHIFFMGRACQKMLEIGIERTKLPQNQKDLIKKDINIFKIIQGFLKMGSTVISLARINIE